jgi:phospholipase/lecithinase/hemolysin
MTISSPITSTLLQSLMKRSISFVVVRMIYLGSRYPMKLWRLSDSLAAMAVELPLLTGSQIRKLITAGATNILVILLPSLNNASVVTQSFSLIQRQVLSQFIAVINERITSNVSAVVKDGVILRFFDVISFTQWILNNPGRYGLVNITDPCLENWQVFLRGTGGEQPKVWGNSDEFLFWNGEHPTARVHAMFGNEVMRFLDWQ